MKHRDFSEIIAAVNERREENGLDRNGKKYSMVKDRIEVFRQEFGIDLGIDTDVTAPYGFTPGNVVIAKAKVVAALNGVVLASGHAMEVIGNSEVSSTAPIESAETKAIGRALACLGLHGGEYASASEMEAVPDMGTYNGHRNDRPRNEGQGNERQGSEGQINQQEERYIPEAIPAQHEVNSQYVPREPFAVWIDYVSEMNKAVDCLFKMKSQPAISSYWIALESFRQALQENDPGSLAELKAAFAVKSDELKSKGH